MRLKNLSAQIWAVAFPFFVRMNKRRASRQLDVMGTVTVRLGMKKIGRRFLTMAAGIAPRNHEHLLPLCGLMKSHEEWGAEAEGYYREIIRLLSEPDEISLPDANQHCRILRALAGYEEKTGRTDEARKHREEIQGLEGVGADQRFKAGV